MRKLLLIVIPLLLSVGISQNKVNINNLVQYGDKMFKENDDKPYTGRVFDLWDNGDIKLEGSYKKGLKDRKWIYYSKNGNRNEYYKNGKLLKEEYFDSKGVIVLTRNNEKESISVKDPEYFLKGLWFTKVEYGKLYYYFDDKINFYGSKESLSLLEEFSGTSSDTQYSNDPIKVITTFSSLGYSSSFHVKSINSINEIGGSHIVIDGKEVKKVDITITRLTKIGEKSSDLLNN